MPCTIKLVLGNHDSLEIYEHRPHNVKIQLPLFVYKHFWLSHCPIHPTEMRDRLGNIHGHLHEEVVTRQITNPFSKGYGKQVPDKRYFNVNIDVNDYQLVPLDTIKEYFKEQSETNR